MLKKSLPRELMITVDVEAFWRRSPVKPVERLIWGHLDSGEGGILALMRIAEKHGVRLTMFFDFTEYGMHGDALLDAAREIRRRGHDLQLHGHPEIMDKAFWESRSLPPLKLQETATDAQARAMMDYIFLMHSKISSDQPVAYRAGGYRHNAAILRALKEFGLAIDSSYNAGVKSGQLMQKGPLDQFYWSNGLLELPITTLAGFGGSSNLIQYNFNSSIFSRGSNLRDFLYDFFIRKPGNVAILVMHSWSLQVPAGSETFDILQPDAVERFDAFLEQIAGTVSVVTANDIAARMRVGKTVSDFEISLDEAEFDNTSVEKNIEPSLAELGGSNGINPSMQLKSAVVRNVIRAHQGALPGVCGVCGRMQPIVNDQIAEEQKLRSDGNLVDVKCAFCKATARQRILPDLYAHVLETSGEIGGGGDGVSRCLAVSAPKYERDLLKSLGYDVTHVSLFDNFNDATIRVGVDISNMPEIETGAYDLFHAINVLDYIQNIEITFKEIRRVLKNRGRVVLFVQPQRLIDREKGSTVKHTNALRHERTFLALAPEQTSGVPDCRHGVGALISAAAMAQIDLALHRAVDPMSGMAMFFFIGEART